MSKFIVGPHQIVRRTGGFMAANKLRSSTSLTSQRSRCRRDG